MILIVVFLVFIFDRITKILAINLLASGEPVNILPGIFNLTLVYNDGTAFGLFKGMNALFIAVAIAVILFIITYIIKNRIKDRVYLFTLGLVIGGAIGNLFDRIAFGCVVDFLDFRIWPVFNLADSCITIGVVILAWKVFTKKCIQSS